VRELGRYITLKLSAHDLRCIDKVGLLQYVKRCS